jgi:hypothetical protein
MLDDIRDRATIDAHFEQIQAVFFTGDLAYHGSEEEYELARKEFVDPLIERLNIKSEKLFFAPGNHDINIKPYEQYAQMWNRGLKSEEQITKFLDSTEDGQLLKPRIENYMEKFLKPLTGRDLQTPGLFYSGEITSESRKITVLSLNTAWLCTGSEYDEPCLGERQLVEALKAAEGAHLTIAIFHHPVGRWREIDDTRNCEILLQKKCGLWLSGHTHQTDIRLISSPVGKWASVSAGAVFDKRKSPLSYNFGFLDLDTGEGIVFFRTYFEGQHEWGPDIGATGKMHNGMMPIKLEALGNAAGEEEGSYTPHICRLPNQEYSRGSDPFSSVTAEGMNADEITRLFVGHHTNLDIAEKRFGTIIEGQRGTGKSMILKYLSFPVQIRTWQNKNREIPAYFDEKRFIGVYCKLQQGIYDKRDLEEIQDETKRGHVFEHRVTADMCVQILETMKEVTSILGLSDKGANGIANRLARILTAPDEWLNNAESLSEILDSYRDVLRQEAKRVDEFLRTAGSSSFSPSLALSGLVYNVITLFQESLGLQHCCLFLLLDDFDVLHDWQQEILFATAAQRMFDLVCFKFGVMSEGVKTGTAGSGRTFRPGDDYDHISLDMVERGLLRKDYPAAVTMIAAKRIKESGWPHFGERIPPFAMDVEEADENAIQTCKSVLSALFPPWKHGLKIREEIKHTMDKEWEESGGKHTKKKNDYYSKYGNARYFQKLRQMKQSERYAGYDYIVTISSGIVRQYLEICSHVISEACKERWNPKAGEAISPEIQDRAIVGYSRAFFENLNKGAGAHGTLRDLGRGITSKDIVDLIEALCDLFYERLHSPNHREPEIITFALRDSNSYVDNLLRVCLRESVLQKFYYPPKTAGQAPLPAYVLNKRLVPRRSLSPLRMQGRIEMNATDIERAIKNNKSLLEKFMQKPSGYQLTLNPLEGALDESDH